MPDAQPQSPRDSTELCANCELLQFDDLANGGYKTLDPDDGSEFLLFNEDDRGREFPTAYEFADDLPDLPALAESAASGCGCCAGIRAAIRKFGSPKLDRAAKVTLRFSYLWKSSLGSTGAWVDPDRGLVAARLYMQSTPGSEIQHVEIDTFVFSVETASESCLKWLRTRPLATQHPLSPRNIAWIQESLAQESLRPRISFHDNEFLPTRLIDLGASDTHASRVNLQTTESLQSTERSPIKYAALSYCWGPQVEAARQFQTTRATLPQRQSGITISETSPVIQDAIRVCRALGFRYLWIDAVCIIQDEAQDWEQEASRMRDVYGNASATICALASGSCTQPFLVDRDAGFTLPFTSHVREGIRGVLNMRCCTRRQNILTTGDEPILKDFMDAPWDNRAWTFQEYHLSRKLIMFCRQRLFIADRLGTTGEAETFADEHLTVSPCVAAIEEAVGAGYPGAEGCPLLNRQWMGLMENYSRRQLSNKTDCLPALSGLASLYRKLLRDDDEYIAGIWRNDLHRQLFWTSHFKQRCSLGERLSSLSGLLYDRSYVAPSWSWISQQQQWIEFGCQTVYMSNIRYSDCAQEFSHAVARLEYKGIDSYGELTSASLDIKSRLLSADHFSPRCERVDAREHPFWRLEDSAQGYVATCNLDWDDPAADKTGSLGVAWLSLSLLLLGSYDNTSTKDLHTEENCISSDAGEDSSDDDNNNGSAEGTIAMSPATKQETLWGLVVYPATGAAGPSEGELRTFYRVGIFYTMRGHRSRLRELLNGCEASTISLM
ncbi:HET domain-containing protein [Microdochium nivale]|nr:HET domain-containing protein [Microdochium nivale]